MVFIGIDVAKDKHDCHIVNSDGEILCDNFSFRNTKRGFEMFLQLFHDRAGKCKAKTGLEATGDYSTNLLRFLKSNGFEVVLFNPLSVSRAKSASTLRRTKTDKSDARYIAEMLPLSEPLKCREETALITQLKSLTRARYRLTKEIQPLKNRYRRLIHLCFPEIEEFFFKLDAPTPLHLFSNLSDAAQVAGCNILKLSSILFEGSHGKFSRNKAEELKSLAKNSIAANTAGDAFELKQTVERINFLDRQKEQLDNELRIIMQLLDSPITSIPGISYVLGATILSEIGSIKAFNSPAKLLAFAGCDPSTYQSGKYTASKTPMVKHGSKYLRNALYLAANAAFVNYAPFREYVNTKRAQGKHFFVAMSHGMKKLSRIIFAVLTKNIPFTDPA